MGGEHAAQQSYVQPPAYEPPADASATDDSRGSTPQFVSGGALPPPSRGFSDAPPSASDAAFGGHRFEDPQIPGQHEPKHVPVPIVTHGTTGRSHADPHAMKRPADENETKWMSFVRNVPIGEQADRTGELIELAAPCWRNGSC